MTSIIVGFGAADVDDERVDMAYPVEARDITPFAARLLRRRRLPAFDDDDAADLVADIDENVGVDFELAGVVLVRFSGSVVSPLALNGGRRHFRRIQKNFNRLTRRRVSHHHRLGRARRRFQSVTNSAAATSSRMGFIIRAPSMPAFLLFDPRVAFCCRVVPRCATAPKLWFRTRNRSTSRSGPSLARNQHTPGPIARRRGKTITNMLSRVPFRRLVATALGGMRADGRTPDSGSAPRAPTAGSPASCTWLHSVARHCARVHIRRDR